MNDPFEVARIIANKSDPVVTRYLHSSVLLDRKGRVIATGRNHWAGKFITAEEDCNKLIRKTVHSEVDALSKVNIRRLDGATMINYARTNVASIMARPCENCWAILKKLDVRKVFYTIRSDLIKPDWREEYF